MIVFVIWAEVNPGGLARTSVEDGPIENLTALFLAISCIGFIIAAKKSQFLKEHPGWWRYVFIVGWILLMFVFTGEEISWGQRVFEIESTEFFMKNSDQQEINVHNVVNKWFNVRTKHIAALVLFFYGVCLPLLNMNPKFEAFLGKISVSIPPVYLVVGFSIGAFLTIDIFSGLEEEIAEFFLGLSLFLFVIHEYISGSPCKNEMVR